MATEHQFEVLNDALNSAIASGDFLTTDAPSAWIKADNRLLDACLDAGMPSDHSDHRVWASTQIWFWLNSAPIKGLWAGTGYARNYSIVAEAA